MLGLLFTLRYNDLGNVNMMNLEKVYAEEIGYTGSITNGDRWMGVQHNGSVVLQTYLECSNSHRPGIVYWTTSTAANSQWCVVIPNCNYLSGTVSLYWTCKLHVFKWQGRCRLFLLKINIERYCSVFFGLLVQHWSQHYIDLQRNN